MLLIYTIILLLFYGAWVAMMSGKFNHEIIFKKPILKWLNKLSLPDYINVFLRLGMFILLVILYVVFIVMYAMLISGQTSTSDSLNQWAYASMLVNVFVLILIIYFSRIKREKNIAFKSLIHHVSDSYKLLGMALILFAIFMNGAYLIEEKSSDVDFQYFVDYSSEHKIFEGKSVIDIEAFNKNPEKVLRTYLSRAKNEKSFSEKLSAYIPYYVETFNDLLLFLVLMITFFEYFNSLLPYPDDMIQRAVKLLESELSISIKLMSTQVIEIRQKSDKLNKELTGLDKTNHTTETCTSTLSEFKIITDKVNNYVVESEKILSLLRNDIKDNINSF